MSKSVPAADVGSDGTTARFKLGPRALRLAGRKAGKNKITSRHLETALAEMEGEIAALKHSRRDAIPRDELVLLANAISDQGDRLSEMDDTIKNGFERLLNTVNGVRYMFELYAVQLSGGDLQQAVHDVNQLIDGLSKPIHVSKSEVEQRRLAEREDGSRAAAEAELHEQVMDVVDGGSPPDLTESYTDRDASEELER